MTVAIEVDRVSKIFRPRPLFHAGLKTMLLHPRQVFGHRRRHGMQALLDVSFDVKRGEFFGLLGRNGAGKSTLLGLIGGILTPTIGEVRLHGRVSPLMELGVGLEPQLTGRENIVLNGVLLGLRRSEVEARMGEIVEFSGLAEFIDEPLFTYSSGMQMRLGFSVAIHADPAILLVDEALSVGDEAFQTRCLDKIDELRRSGVTIVLVSHDLHLIESTCDRAAWLDGGRLRAIGSPQAVVKEYRYALGHPTEEEGSVAVHWRTVPATPQMGAPAGGGDEAR
jgi:lipopolysaccharide transport system ATP-binding protein